MHPSLRIALVAPPLERVPPHAYGGTERIVHELAHQLVTRGHDVTIFASGDSDVPGRHVPTVPEALRPAGFGGDPSPWFLATVLEVLERATEFDVIHSHLEWYSSIIAAVAPVPVVTTWHGRLDFPWARDMLQAGGIHPIAISQSQASTHPDVDWLAVVHNGLTLDAAPFGAARGDDLCFVGRPAPEKGLLDALEIARLSGRRIRVAAKDGYTPQERDYHEGVIMPALRAMGGDAEYLGELSGAERDRLFAESYATLMPGSWPEPFGLVAIESLACGTPILARRIGALPEIIRDGIDGFFGDDVPQLAFHVNHVALLDRASIRASVLGRFSASRMTDDYERLYRRLLSLEDVVGEAVGPGRAAGAGQARMRPPIMIGPSPAGRVGMEEGTPPARPSRVVTRRGGSVSVLGRAEPPSEPPEPSDEVDRRIATTGTRPAG